MLDGLSGNHVRQDLTVEEATGIGRGQGEENLNETLAELRNFSDMKSVNVMLVGCGEPEGVLRSSLSFVVE